MNEKYHVHFIVEGCEEEYFFRIVQSKGTHPTFEISVYNAGGHGGVAPHFQDAYADETYDAVFCVYDTDNRQSEENSPYSLIQKGLESILGDPNKVILISLCTSPNILQMYLLGCDKLERVKLPASGKMENSTIVHRYWEKIGRGRKDGKGRIVSKGYDASTWQLEIMANSFIYDGEVPSYSYDVLLQNAEALPVDYVKSRGAASNLLPVLLALKEGNTAFFNEIQEKLKKDTEDNRRNKTC